MPSPQRRLGSWPSGRATCQRSRRPREACPTAAARALAREALPRAHSTPACGRVEGGEGRACDERQATGGRRGGKDPPASQADGERGAPVSARPQSSAIKRNQERGAHQSQLDRVALILSRVARASHVLLRQREPSSSEGASHVEAGSSGSDRALSRRANRESEAGERSRRA